MCLYFLSGAKNVTEGTVNKAVPASANHEIVADKPSKELPAKCFHISHVQRFDNDKCIICQVAWKGSKVKGSSYPEHQWVWQCIPLQSS